MPCAWVKRSKLALLGSVVVVAGDPNARNFLGNRGRREHGSVGGASLHKVCLVTRDWAFPLKALDLRVIHYLATPTKVRFGRLAVVARCVGRLTREPVLVKLAALNLETSGPGRCCRSC